VRQALAVREIKTVKMSKKVIYEGEVWEMDDNSKSDDSNLVRIYRLDDAGKHRWKYVSRGTLGPYNYFWQFRDSVLHFLHNITKQ
jgi:hypothetical protein